MSKSKKKGELLVPFTDYLPERPIVVAHDLRFVCDRVQQIFDEGFAEQALAEQAATSEMELSEVYARFAASRLLVSGNELQAQLEGSIFWQWVRGSGTKSATGSEKVPTVVFHTQPQPLFHKNFEQVLDAFVENLANGQRTFVLADSEKQQERLRDILGELMQTTGKRAEGALSSLLTSTLHEGFSDTTIGAAFYTDHQIFDRFHKYNLRSDHARNAKMSLTLKEIRQFEPGDYVVHVDHGVGQFVGLMRIPGGDGAMQEVIKIKYQNNDAIFVSIHALHKVSKYKGKEGAPPRLSHLGTGAWMRLKDRTKKKLKDIARDLILLYSRRRAEKRFLLSRPTVSCSTSSRPPSLMRIRPTNCASRVR